MDLNIEKLDTVETPISWDVSDEFVVGASVVVVLFILFT